MDRLDAFHQRQSAMIARYGWAVTAVFPTAEHAADENVQPFAYTVGLTAHGYPELVIAGLPGRLAHALLNDLASRVFDRAERFTAGQQITDLLDGYPVVIVEGPATDQLYPGAAFGRYGRDAVQLQQIVWPDRDGRFPWDDGYLYPPHVQPLLGTPPPPSAPETR